MLSPASQRPSHRTPTAGVIIAVTVLILFSLFSLRDATTASSGSPEHSSSDRKDTATIPTYDAIESTPSVAHKSAKEQDTIKIPAYNASVSSIAAAAAVDGAKSLPPVESNEPRRAFVTFLEADTGANRGDSAQGVNSDNEDVYFVGVFYRPRNLTSPSH